MFSAIGKVLLSIEHYCEENFLFDQLKSELSTHLVLKARGMEQLERRYVVVEGDGG
jgi:hypothetical protein